LINLSNPSTPLVKLAAPAPFTKVLPVLLLAFAPYSLENKSQQKLGAAPGLKKVN
jgi:hypothetical protein